MAGGKIGRCGKGKKEIFFRDILKYGKNLPINFGMS